MPANEPAFTGLCAAASSRGTASDAAPSAEVTRRAAGKLFQKKKIREVRRMLLIAVGLTVALVAADLLDLTRRGDEKPRGLSLRK
jgi:hypothetical protein